MIFRSCKGFLLPETFLNDSDIDSQWKCTKCQSTRPSYAIHGVLEEIGRKLEGMEKGSSKACKEFITASEEKLHPNHYYITDVKVALAQLIGQELEGGLPAISDEDLEMKARICKKLNDLIETLAPGICIQVIHKYTGYA